MKIPYHWRVSPSAKDQGMFSPFAVMQQLNHCGPCSLSSCLFMLGIEANQRDLARTAAGPIETYREGTAPEGLLKAIEKFGAAYQKLSEPKQNGPAFIDKLIAHLSETGPALLSIDNGKHWIAAVGYFPDKAKFVVYDPLQDAPFYQWTSKHLLLQCWDIDDEDGIFEYPAILLSRKDGRPPVWQITEKWMKIHNRGSDCTAVSIASDLKDLVKNAYGEVPQSASVADFTSESIRLSELLETYRGHVLNAILHWQEGSSEYTKKDLKDLYSDYVTCADACRLHISKKADHAALVAGLTALFSAYWWGAEMG